MHVRAPLPLDAIEIEQMVCIPVSVCVYELWKSHQLGTLPANWTWVMSYITCMQSANPDVRYPSTTGYVLTINFAPSSHQVAHLHTAYIVTTSITYLFIYDTLKTHYTWC